MYNLGYMGGVSQWDKAHILIRWICGGQAKVSGERNRVWHFVLLSKGLAALAAIVPIVSWLKEREREEISGLLPPREVGTEVEEARNRDLNTSRRDLHPLTGCRELLSLSSRGGKKCSLSLLHFILSSWELLYVISVRGKNMVFLFPLSPRLQNSKFTANYSPVNSGLTL